MYGERLKTVFEKVSSKNILVKYIWKYLKWRKIGNGFNADFKGLILVSSLYSRRRHDF